MDIIIDSVNKLAEIIHHSGCEEGGVRLEVNADAKPCQYERGACMVASLGGRSAEFVTDDPIRAMTKISFLTGAPLDTLATRGAACAIINVALNFFCLSRVCHACPVSAHASCRKQLHEKLAGHTIHCIGTMPVISSDMRQYITNDPQNAEIILINGEGIIAKGTGDIIASPDVSKRILCLGPSTAGVARLWQWEHWCPYGT
jgi:hypothetical protein